MNRKRDWIIQRAVLAAGYESVSIFISLIELWFGESVLLLDARNMRETITRELSSLNRSYTYTLPTIPEHQEFDPDILNLSVFQP